jgi:predicted ester cyclase
MSWLLLGCVILMSNNYAREGSHPFYHLKKREEKMNNSQNKETVRRLYDECLNKRNYALLKELFSAEYIGPNGEKGPESFERTIKPLILAFPDIQWTVEDILEEGDKVAVRHSLKGTHTATFRGLAATGTVVTNTGMALFAFKGDKIIASWTETDRLGFNQQLGVVPTELYPVKPKP